MFFPLAEKAFHRAKTMKIVAKNYAPRCKFTEITSRSVISGNTRHRFLLRDN